MRWQACWVDSDGQPRSKAFTTRDAAVAHLHSLGQPTATTAQRVTVAAYAETWMAHQLHWADRTRASAETRMRRTIVPSLPEWIGDVTRADVQAAVATWKLAPSTVQVAYSYLSSMMRTAVLDGVIPASPCVRIRLPRRPRAKVVPLTTGQVLAIRDAMTPAARSMVVVGAATGLRPAELAGLTWDRVVGGAVTVDRQLAGVRPLRWGPPKSRAGVRTVALGQVALAALKEHRDVYGVGPGGLVWQTAAGTAVSRTVMSERWRAAVRGMGLPARSGWHMLRHYSASRLIAAGLSPRAVADRLGHADVAETLQTYAHLWPDDQARAAAAMDASLGV